MSLAIVIVSCSPSDVDPVKDVEAVTSVPAPLPRDLPLSPEVARFEPPATFLQLPDEIDSVFRDRVRTKTVDLLSPRPYPPKSPATAVPIGIAANFGIHADWFLLKFSDGQEIRTAILRPDEGDPTSLVVTLHGHDEAGLGGIDLLLNPDSYQHGIAVALAQDGHAVLAIETRGFGQSPTGLLQHEVYTGRLRMQGREFHGQVVSDNREVLDFALEMLPGIERVGAVGCSMGGLSALFLSVLDSRIEDVLVSGIMGSFAGSFSSHLHCHCSLIPGILRDLDIPQLVAASQAQRIALENGDRDPSLGTVNLAPIRKEIEILKAQVDRDFVFHQFDGGHEHDLDFVIDFFAL